MRQPFKIIEGGRRPPLLTRRELTQGVVMFVVAAMVGALLMFGPPFVRSEQGRQDAASISVRIIDGDTVEVRGSNERVRLMNIDTPEMGDGARCQAERTAASRARRALQQIVQDARTITLHSSGGQDRYGRTLGTLRADGRDIGRMLIEQGHARPWRGRREPWCADDGSLLP